MLLIITHTNTILCLVLLLSHLKNWTCCIFFFFYHKQFFFHPFFFFFLLLLLLLLLLLKRANPKKNKIGGRRGTGGIKNKNKKPITAGYGFHRSRNAFKCFSFSSSRVFKRLSLKILAAICFCLLFLFLFFFVLFCFCFFFFFLLPLLSFLFFPHPNKQKMNPKYFCFGKFLPPFTKDSNKLFGKFPKKPLKFLWQKNKKTVGQIKC